MVRYVNVFTGTVLIVKVKLDLPNVKVYHSYILIITIVSVTENLFMVCITSHIQLVPMMELVRLRDMQNQLLHWLISALL